MSTVKHGKSHNPALGATLAFLAMTFFSVQDALIKHLAVDVSLFQILFMRSLVILFPIVLILRIRYGKGAFRTARPKDHLLRVSFNFFAFLSFYFAISRLPLSDATAIALSAPLIMTALSGPLLGEPADWRRKAILIFGFTGVLIVIQPGSGTHDWPGVLAALAGASGFALLAIQTRKMAATESTELMVFYGAASFLLVTGVIMLSQWQTPDALTLGILLGTGVITLFAQYFIVHSYQFAAVYVIAPFEYITIIWAILIGWWWFAEIPTPMMLAGAAIIVLSGMMIVQIERRDARMNATRLARK